jgi:hypothetical protein
MIVDAKEKFNLKKISDKGATGFYEAYLSVIEGTENSVCDKSIKYLKAFVNYSPYTCIRIIRSKENNLFSLRSWGNEYIYLLSAIAAYHLDKSEMVEGLLWADKAIDLVDYFAPTLNKNVRDEILYNLPASAMVCAFPKQYLKIPSDKFFLGWEIRNYNYSGNEPYLNDN